MTDQLHGPSEPDPADQDTADSLRIARPVPAAAFRGRLRRQLSDRDPGFGPRPERLRLIVAGYVVAGGLLIALAALVFS
ncbi:MAG: hypothetical protein ACXVFQ_19555 [Solirubrobacteraceae bacterium]